MKTKISYRHMRCNKCRYCIERDNRYRCENPKSKNYMNFVSINDSCRYIKDWSTVEEIGDKR